MQEQQRNPSLLPCYSLFRSDECDPLALVRRELPKLAALCKSQPTPSLGSAALSGGHVVPPPGFARPQTMSMTKDPVEEKKLFEEVITSASIMHISSRSSSPLAFDGSSTPSSASSSAASSRKGSFSSDASSSSSANTSPLLSGLKPTIRVLSTPLSAAPMPMQQQQHYQQQQQQPMVMQYQHQQPQQPMQQSLAPQLPFSTVYQQQQQHQHHMLMQQQHMQMQQQARNNAYFNGNNNYRGPYQPQQRRI